MIRQYLFAHAHPQGEEYITPAGPLGFSLLLFVLGNAVVLAIFMWNRWAGGELGGSATRQWITFAAFAVGVYT